MAHHRDRSHGIELLLTIDRLTLLKCTAARVLHNALLAEGEMIAPLNGASQYGRCKQ